MNKKKLIISAAGIAILGGGMYFGLAYSLPLVTSQIIRQNGFPEARVSHFYVTPNGVMIDHISLDSNDFSTVDEIQITLNWFKFIKERKIDSLSVKDISLTAELDEAGHLKIAGWDATLPQSSGGSALLPLQSLLLKGITIDLDTPQGDIRVEGKLSLDTPNEKEQNLQYAVWGQQHQLSFDTKGSGKLLSNGDISLSTTLNEGRLNLPNIELSRASGQLTVLKPAGGKPSIYSGQLIAGKINTLGALLQNVAITLDTSKDEALFFQTSPAGYKDISIAGRWVTSPDNHLEMTLTSKKTMDVVDLLAPDQSKKMKSYVGDANPLSLTLTAPLTSLQADKKAAAYTLNLGQDKTENSLQAEGKVSFDAQTGTTSFQLDKTKIGVAGGTIDLSQVTLNTNYQGDPPLDILLTVTSVDMTKLAKLADVKGLNAQGILSGSLPLTYSNKGIVFGKGNLKSESEGSFAYTPDEFPASLQGDDARMKTVRQTLSDFRFTKFNVEMSGSVDDKMKTTLSAEGTNPALGDRPIHLNLNLDGDLGAVLKQTLKIDGLAGDMSDTIRSQMKKDKK